MEFTAPLWESKSMGAWCFVTLPADLSDDLRMTTGPPKGFGSIRVEVTVGSSVWRTSVFPDKGSGCYVLPMKKAVRRAEDLEVGEAVVIGLAVVTDE